MSEHAQPVSQLVTKPARHKACQPESQIAIQKSQKPMRKKASPKTQANQKDSQPPNQPESQMVTWKYNTACNKICLSRHSEQFSGNTGIQTSFSNAKYNNDRRTEAYTLLVTSVIYVIGH